MPLLRICLVGLLCFALHLQPALAGAWPRDKGSGFASTGVRLTWPQDALRQAGQQPSQQYRTFFAEFGLTDRLTLGLDLGRSVSGGNKSVVFLRWPLRNRDDGMKLAFELGAGQIGGQTVIRPGLALGWGLERGWLSIDTLAEVGLDRQTTDWKVDVTWGRVMEKDRKLLLQMQMGKPKDAEPFMRFEPSLVMPMGKRLKLQGGASWGLTGDDSFGVIFGLWTSF